MTQVVRVLVDGASGLEFDYSIPDKIKNKVVVGSRIRVPLRNRASTGTVVAFISSDEFIDVKRYSSLLPREVLTNIFNESAGKVISVNANNGDKYMINIIDFKKPSEADIVEIIEQYEAFADESISTRISNIVNEDVFEKAKVKLQNVLL